MCNDCGKCFGAGVCMGTIISIIILSISHFAIVFDFQKQAIKHQAARYNPTTAKFEWVAYLGCDEEAVPSKN